MEQVFYLITNCEVVNSDNQITSGVRVEKITLSSESRDFKTFCGTSFAGSGDLQSTWESYIDEFFYLFKQELEKQRDLNPWAVGSLWVYESLLLWESQYQMLSGLMQTGVIEREVKICELV
jgi:hypothetical protein